jgi:hypothetical protein
MSLYVISLSQAFKSIDFVKKLKSYQEFSLEKYLEILRILTNYSK